MKIALASDHAGYALKEEVKTLLTSRGHETVDFGADDENPPIVFVDHEADPEEEGGLIPVAGSFSELLGRLKD